MNKIFTQLVEERGFTSDFLEPQYENLTDPFALPDMDKAIARLKKALADQEKILIYGDYDADGVTASTLMEQALILAGAQPANISIMLPDRFADGYGMSPRLIKRAEELGVTLVITVDCGSRNHAIVDELNTLHIDSVITDHHETEDTLPEAVAVLNPKRKDVPCEKLIDLAGVGVAFKVAEALVKEGQIKDGQEKWLLDLVLIGTICDSMTMSLENRILCYYGMKVLTKTRRPGLLELFKTAGIRTFNSDAIGFQIGPRINASGRLKTAEIALDLLRTSSRVEAADLAAKVEELNRQRKVEQRAAISEIKERGLQPGPVIIETGKWHEGIIGIVAGHLVEDYHKPAFVLTETENGIFKGSGRSFGEFSLAEALAATADCIIGGGGHAAAAGVKVARENLYRFREQIQAYYESLNLKDQARFLKQSPDVILEDFSGLDLDFLNSLKSLEPYGPGNEEPLFLLRNVQIAKVTRMGQESNHLRLDLIDRDGKPLKLIAFFAPGKWLQLTPDSQIEPLIVVNENEFRGVRSLEGRIVGLNVL